MGCFTHLCLPHIVPVVIVVIDSLLIDVEDKLPVVEIDEPVIVGTVTVVVELITHVVVKVDIEPKPEGLPVVIETVDGKTVTVIIVGSNVSMIVSGVCVVVVTIVIGSSIFVEIVVVFSVICCVGGGAPLTVQYTTIVCETTVDVVETTEVSVVETTFTV